MKTVPLNTKRKQQAAVTSPVEPVPKPGSEAEAGVSGSLRCSASSFPSVLLSEPPERGVCPPVFWATHPQVYTSTCVAAALSPQP